MAPFSDVTVPPVIRLPVAMLPRWRSSTTATLSPCPRSDAEFRSIHPSETPNSPCVPERRYEHLVLLGRDGFADPSPLTRTVTRHVPPLVGVPLKHPGYCSRVDSGRQPVCRVRCTSRLPQSQVTTQNRPPPSRNCASTLQKSSWRYFSHTVGCRYRNRGESAIRKCTHARESIGDGWVCR